MPFDRDVFLRAAVSRKHRSSLPYCKGLPIEQFNFAKRAPSITREIASIPYAHNNTVLRKTLETDLLQQHSKDGVFVKRSSSTIRPTYYGIKARFWQDHFKLSHMMEADDCHFAHGVSRTRCLSTLRDIRNVQSMLTSGHGIESFDQPPLQNISQDAAPEESKMVHENLVDLIEERRQLGDTNSTLVSGRARTFMHLGIRDPANHNRILRSTKGLLIKRIEKHAESVRRHESESTKWTALLAILAKQTPSLPKQDQSPKSQSISSSDISHYHPQHVEPPTTNPRDNPDPVVSSKIRRQPWRRVQTDSLESTNIESYIYSTVSERLPIVDRGRHIENRTKALLDIFKEFRSTTDVITTRAFNAAFIFLHEFRKLPEARTLFTNMPHHGCKPNVVTFNLFLRYCAKDQNLPAFRHWLELMLDHGIRPNYATWGALIEVAPRIRDKQAIVHEIYHRNLVQNNHAANQVIAMAVPYSLGQFLSEDGDVQSYIQAICEAFNASHIDGNATKAIMDTLGLHGRVTEATNLLESFVVQYQYNPTIADLNILIFYCTEHLNADTAIALLKKAAVEWTITPNETTYKHLFRLFWNCRMYNSLRVVWKYACLNNKAKSELKWYISRSLQWGLNQVRDKETQTPLQKGQASVRNKWKANAGLVACHPLISTQALRETRGTASEVDLTIRSDLNLHHHYFPRNSLEDMLIEAHVIDKRWIVEEVRRKDDIAWKLKHCVHIPVETHAFKSSTRRPQQHV